MKSFIHESTLHKRGGASSILNQYGVAGYGVAMVLLEALTSKGNDQVNVSDEFIEGFSRYVNFDSITVRKIINDMVISGFVNLNDGKITSIMSNKKEKAENTLKVIEEDDLFKVFCTELIARRSSETHDSLSFQREKFLNHLKAKGKKYVDYKAAFENWLDSKYRVNPQTPQSPTSNRPHRPGDAR